MSRLDVILIGMVVSLMISVILYRRKVRILNIEKLELKNTIKEREVTIEDLTMKNDHLNSSNKSLSIDNEYYKELCESTCAEYSLFRESCNTFASMCRTFAEEAESMPNLTSEINKAIKHIKHSNSNPVKMRKKCKNCGGVSNNEFYCEYCQTPFD